MLLWSAGGDSVRIPQFIRHSLTIMEQLYVELERTNRERRQACFGQSARL